MTTQSTNIALSSKREVIPAERMRGAQLLHFILVNVLSFAGAAIALCTLVFSTVRHGTILVLALMWVVTGGFGISLGFHRLFTHKSFETG